MEKKLDPIYDYKIEGVCDSDLRKTYLSALKKVSEIEWDTPSLAGQGIVICGDGAKYWNGIVCTVKLLRNELNYNDNIKVFHWGDIGNQLNNLVDLIDVRELWKRHPQRIQQKGWVVKTLAIKYCGFKKVIYLDADAYCVSNPQPLLDIDCDFGYWGERKQRINWEALGVKNLNYPSIQGGHLVINNEKFWRELCITHWATNHSDYYYKLMFGDEDLWRFIFTYLQSGPHHMIDRSYWKRFYYTNSYNGKPMIIHRCASKLAGRRPRTDAIPMEEELFKYYRELVNEVVPTTVVMAGRKLIRKRKLYWRKKKR